ncbi:MAG: protein kinase, partial [Flavobacteriaceae bacterium]|nr:protein kinase [Flavobacteriaceae bacterium]
LMMKWSEGTKTSDWIKTYNLVSISGKKSFITLFISFLNELVKVHNMGFIHGDLQPSHILIKRNSFVDIIDFGLSHSVNSYPSFGNYRGGMIHFNSPELCLGILNSNDHVKVGFQSEIYSIGSLFYFLYTKKTSTQYGSKSYKELEYEDMLRMIIDRPICSFSELRLPKFDFLERVLCKCLEKNPKDRYQNIEHLLFDLNSFF